MRLLQAQPLTLHQAIDQALAHNQTILFSAKESYAASQASLAATEAAYASHLDFSLSTTRSYARTAFETPGQSDQFLNATETQNLIPSFGLRRSVLTSMGSRTTLGLNLTTNVVGLSTRSYQLIPQLSISLQQPLSSAGIAAGHSEITRARVNFIHAELGFELQKEELIVAVVNAYYQLWLAFKDVERAQRELQSAQHVLQIAELRLRAKSVAESEVLNSRVQFVGAEDNLAVAENSLQNQERSFAQLLGRDFTQPGIALTDTIAMDTVRIELQEVIAQALATRREVRQAELGLELAELGVDVAASSNDPVLQVTSNYSLSSLNAPSFDAALDNFPSRTWSVQASVSFPLFDGGAAKNQLEIARSSCKIQENNLRLLRQNIALEVEQIWRGLKLNERRMSTLALNVQIAEEALKIAELRFQHGQISSNEVEQVRSRYLATQESLNNARVSYKIQSATLAKAMGKLADWVDRQQ